MPYPLFADNSFPPNRNDLCFCNSGERFKRCCGSLGVEAKIPSGINIVDNFLSADECKNLRDLADSMQGNRFIMTDSNGQTVLDQHRMTEWVSFQNAQQDILDQLIAKAFEEQIIPTSRQEIEWYEEPQLLRYASGDYYLHHSDAYHLMPEKNAWKKVVDRDISVLIYINDDYEGGMLDFKRFPYQLHPKAGMLVWFPSDVRYEHMAMPVTSGRRYALVSWAAATGVERVQAERAKRSILWATKEKKIPIE